MPNRLCLLGRAPINKIAILTAFVASFSFPSMNLVDAQTCPPRAGLSPTWCRPPVQNPGTVPYPQQPSPYSPYPQQPNQYSPYPTQGDGNTASAPPQQAGQPAPLQYSYTYYCFVDVGGDFCPVNGPPGIVPGTQCYCGQYDGTIDTYKSAPQ